MTILAGLPLARQSGEVLLVWSGGSHAGPQDSSQQRRSKSAGKSGSSLPGCNSEKGSLTFEEFRVVLMFRFSIGFGIRVKARRFWGELAGNSTNPAQLLQIVGFTCFYKKPTAAASL